ncbi:hypothetical protein BDFB_015133 [Asbolus verrucosus]|uniref:Uncharacterized protein n=1 Tax=Asbolus verrucosus TaxID=1661398 RepID=A0A482VD68_ASBVE|nr:hypothetical protein BDFB_015133 [Asbolus verrucosus]
MGLNSVGIIYVKREQIGTNGNKREQKEQIGTIWYKREEKQNKKLFDNVEHKAGSRKNTSLDEEADELISKSLETFQS